MPQSARQSDVTWTDIIAYTLATAFIIASPYLFTSITITIPVSEVVALFVALNIVLWRVASRKKIAPVSTQ